MKMPDIPYWTAAGLNLAALIVVVLVMMSDRNIIVFLQGIFWVLLNSIFFMFNISNVFSRKCSETQTPEETSRTVGGRDACLE